MISHRETYQLKSEGDWPTCLGWKYRRLPKGQVIFHTVRTHFSISKFHGRMRLFKAWELISSAHPGIAVLRRAGKLTVKHLKAWIESQKNKRSMAAAVSAESEHWNNILTVYIYTLYHMINEYQWCHDIYVPQTSPGFRTSAESEADPIVSRWMGPRSSCHCRLATFFNRPFAIRPRPPFMVGLLYVLRDQCAIWRLKVDHKPWNGHFNGESDD